MAQVLPEENATFMKFQFDAHLPHQSTAIQSVLGVFAGSRAGDGRDYATALQTFDTELFKE